MLIRGFGFFLAAGLWAMAQAVAQPVVREHVMSLAKAPGWVSLLGGWDAEGRPYFKDMALVTRANLRMFEGLYYPDQIQLDHYPGEQQPRAGIDVIRQSDGGGETWSAHVPLLVDLEMRPFRSYRITGPGRKAVDGKLEGEGAEAPVVRIEQEGDRLRWAVSAGAFVEVRTTVDEGEQWLLAGSTAKGEMNLSSYAVNDLLIRFQVFRGLACYVALYDPGQGFLKDTRRAVQPGSFEAGKEGAGILSTNPLFYWGWDDSELPANYKVRAKIRWDWSRVPFDRFSLFPGVPVQLIFQGGWRNVGEVHDVSGPYRFKFGCDLMRDPKGVDDLMLYRVSQVRGQWIAEPVQQLYYEKTGKEGRMYGGESWRAMKPGDQWWGWRIPQRREEPFDTWWVVAGRRK